MKKIMAMILAGGRVNELQVLTLNRPKSTVPFGGMYRTIDFPLSNLMHSGIEKVGVLSQYHSASLVSHIGVGSSWDMIGNGRGVTVLPPFKAENNSDWYKGSADAVYQNIRFIEDYNPDLVLVLSGDHVYRMDYGELIDYHLTKKADVTAVFKELPIEPASRYGTAVIDNEDKDVGGKIVEYSEKTENSKSNWASLTIYLFNKDVLLKSLYELEKQSKSFEFGYDILPKMVSKCRFYGFRFYDYWGYTKTLKEYWQTNMDLLGNNPLIKLDQWEVRTNLSHRNLRDRIPTIISDTAKVENSLIYNGCNIEGHVRNSIIFPGVTVKKNSQISDSIIMFDTKIEKKCTINKTILDTDILINQNCHIGYELPENSNVVQNNGITVIGQSTTIQSNNTIEKGSIVSADSTIIKK